MLFHYLQGEISTGAMLAWIIGAAVAITVHEYAHARRALAAGDETARAMGRVTLNPLAHYDPIGSTMLIVLGFGWAKPVPVNPMNFRRPRWDNLWVSFWGPLSNLLLAAVLSIPLRLGVLGPYTDAVRFMVYINIVLAVFNLIPLPPLDGSHILTSLLPVKAARKLEAFFSQNMRFMMIGFVLLLVTGLDRHVFALLSIPMQLLFRVMTGSFFMF